MSAGGRLLVNSDQTLETSELVDEELKKFAAILPVRKGMYVCLYTCANTDI